MIDWFPTDRAAASPEGARELTRPESMAMSRFRNFAGMSRDASARSVG